LSVTINNSNYNVQEKILEIAKNYFNLEDTNLLKIGLFGYITEVSAQLIRDGVFHRDFLYNEMFLNTANLPASIYNHAKNHNYNIGLSTPARIKALFSFPKQDLINLGTYNYDNNKRLVNISIGLTQDDVFYAGDYSFLVLAPITIVATPNNSQNNYSITATYNTTDTLFSEFSSPYIKSWSLVEDNIEWVVLSLDLVQVIKTSNQFSVYSEDISENLLYNIEFEGQLAAFTINYNHSSLNSMTGVEIPAYFDSLIIPEDEMYCYYSYPSESELQIFFSGLPNTFYPKFNSDLKINVYTTQGSSGNFSYTDNLSLIFSKENNQFEKATILITPITDSAGGTDRPTLKQIKTGIIQDNLLRNNLITDTDLNLFFNQISTESILNDNLIQFIKKRDDIISRVYTGFVLLKDNNEKIIPTNTIDTIDITQDYLESNDFMISQGTNIIYEKTSDSYRLLTEEEDPDDFLNEANYLLYTIPVLMKVVTEPFPKIIYYRNLITSEHLLEYQYNNSDVIYEFILTNLEVIRNNFENKYYDINLNLNTTLDKNNLNNIKIRAIIRTDDVIYGYFDFEWKENFDYNYKIYTLDIFDSNGNILINNPIVNTNPIKDLETGEALEDFYLPEDFYLQISVLYTDETIPATPVDIYKYDDFNLMTDIDEYTTAVVNKSDSVSLHKSLGNIMFSDLYINQEIISATPTDDFIFTIKSIPVVSTKFFNYEANRALFYNLLLAYENIILNNLSRTQNNTNLDLKLYNTFGVSKYWSMPNTPNLPTTFLSLKLAIKFNTTCTSEMEQNIKDFIKDFIESINNSSTTISISNLNRELENNFSNIRYIEYKNINSNTNIQTIKLLYPNMVGLSDEQINNYVPEFINVGSNYDSDGIPISRIEIEIIN